jgi:hypothetical protein
LVDVQFRAVLVAALAVRDSGPIVNRYDFGIYQLETILAYENEAGEMVQVRETV